jgi:hypothetical protein
MQNKVIIQESEVRPDLSGEYKLLVYTDGVILLGINMITMKKNTGVLTDASKGFGFCVYAGKTQDKTII